MTMLFSSFHCTFFLLLGRLPAELTGETETGVVISAAAAEEREVTGVIESSSACM